MANSDGLVYAFRRDGSQVPGFPVHSDPLPSHGGRSHGARGAFLASPAVVAASALLGYMGPPGQLGLTWEAERFGV